MERPEGNATNEDLNSYIDNLLEKIEDLELDVSRLEDEIDIHEQTIEDLEEDNDDLEKEMWSLENLEDDAKMYRKYESLLECLPKDLDIITEEKITEYIKQVTR